MASKNDRMARIKETQNKADKEREQDWENIKKEKKIQLKESSSNEIKFNDIKVYPHFRSRFEELPNYKLIELAQNINDFGFRDNIEVARIDGEIYLVDGHNRRELVIKKLVGSLPGISEVIRPVDINDEQWVDLLVHYIDSKQTSRRNLTDIEEKYVIGRNYSEYVNKSVITSTKNKNNAAELIGERYGISRSSIIRASKVFNALEIISSYSFTKGLVKELKQMGSIDIKVSQLESIDTKTLDVLEKLINPGSTIGTVKEFVNLLNETKEKEPTEQSMDEFDTKLMKIFKIKSVPKNKKKYINDKILELQDLLSRLK